MDDFLDEIEVLDELEDLESKDLYEISLQSEGMIEVELETRTFLLTPFSEYTVTEGFCLVFFLALFVVALNHFIRRFI